jgi:hypothetical protein
MRFTIDATVNAVAPRGRRQAPESSLSALEEVLLADPLITLRAAATRAGVSRDTAHRVRQKLVRSGSLRAPGRRLNLDRNRERFRRRRDEHPQLCDWRPGTYRRYRPVSMTIRIGFPAVDGGPDWQEKVAVEWLHRCAEAEDRCGRNGRGEDAPCQLLIEEGIRHTRRQLVGRLVQVVETPQYRRDVLGEAPRNRSAPTWISAHRL